MDDKFNKTLDDDALNEVSGGFLKEMQKDIKFLNDMGANLSKNATCKEICHAWRFFGGIGTAIMKNYDNNYALKYKMYGGDVNTIDIDTRDKISRHDAMIYAMRNADKYLNLEDYI